MSESDAGPSSMIERISLVLDAFNGSEPLTLAQVTAKTGLPRSSVHRLLEQLTGAGWLARDDLTYELGLKAYEFGQAALSQNRLLREARPVMAAAAHHTGHTFQLGILNGGDTIYLAKANGRLSGPTPTAVGRRVPAHRTAQGKALLAYTDSATLPGACIGEEERFVPDDPAERARWLSELRQIRDRGAAFDRGQSFSGIGCVGVIIGPPDHLYGGRAALSICAPVGAVDFGTLVAPARITAKKIWDRCVATDLATH